MTQHCILVPRHLDADNINAQNLNARALLARFRTPSARWLTLAETPADPAVLQNPVVDVVPLWGGRWWLLRHWLFCLQRADALFYPGCEAVDALALRSMRLLYPRRPVLATMESLPGTEAREQQLSSWAGHPVRCNRVSPAVMARIDGILQAADHVIALSPFLAALGRQLYGDKFSVLPLGIDGGIFHAGPPRSDLVRLRVVSAGRVAAHKRPELFLALAQQHPQVDFCWYGAGELRHTLLAQARAQGLSNVDFPGPLQATALAAAFRCADLFVMPSLSEGVPKVTQEAAACGLPVVLFGFYEAPSVLDGANGFVVWDDAAFMDRIAQLLGDATLRQQQRDTALRMAQGWDWDVLAPQWEALLLAQVERLCRSHGTRA